MASLISNLQSTYASELTGKVVETYTDAILQRDRNARKQAKAYLKNIQERRRNHGANIGTRASRHWRLTVIWEHASHSIAAVYPVGYDRHNGVSNAKKRDMAKQIHNLLMTYFGSEEHFLSLIFTKKRTPDSASVSASSSYSSFSSSSSQESDDSRIILPNLPFTYADWKRNTAISGTWRPSSLKDLDAAIKSYAQRESWFESLPGEDTSKDLTCASYNESCNALESAGAIYLNSSWMQSAMLDYLSTWLRKHMHPAMMLYGRYLLWGGRDNGEQREARNANGYFDRLDRVIDQLPSIKPEITALIQP